MLPCVTAAVCRPKWGNSSPSRAGADRTGAARPYPAAMNAPSERRTAPPRSVLVATVAWVLLGIVLISAWLTGGAGTADESVDTITGALGDSVVAGGGAGPGLGLAFLLLGIAIALLGAGLPMRTGWALWPLTLAGIGGVIVLALDGRFLETPLAMLLVVVGSMALMTGGARRFLGST